MSCDQYHSQHQYYRCGDSNFYKLIIMENGGIEEVGLIREKNRTTKAISK
jgi:hypothetical protein